MSAENNQAEICNTCTLAGNGKALLAREWALAPLELSAVQKEQFQPLTMADKDQALQCRSQILRRICTSVVIPEK